MGKNISRRNFLKAAAAGAAGLGAIGAMGMPAFATEAAAGDYDYLTLDPSLLPSLETVTEWHEFKASMGPLYPAYPNFPVYMDWLREKCKELGCVDFLEHKWEMNDYYVNDWPEHDGVMSISIDGEDIPTATFLRCTMPTADTTAELVYYDIANGEPAAGAFEGKIVYMEPKYYFDVEKPFTSSFMGSYVLTDYDYSTTPDYGVPLLELVDPTKNCSWMTRWDFGQWGTLQKYAAAGGAVGMIVGSQLTYGCLEGLYDRTRRHDQTCLVVDCKSREKVREYAQAGGKMATLKLEAEFKDVENQNFICFLPGVNYGTDKDEYISINCHVDAMALTQDNGCLGCIGILDTFSKIPQENRLKTILFACDTRHFIEGGDNGEQNIDHDPYRVFPEVVPMVTATIGLEHMGEISGALDFENNTMVPTGEPELTYYKADDNDWCAEMVIKASIDSGLQGANLKIDGRPGMHGMYKGVVRAVMAQVHRLGCCEIGQAGNWCGAHTQTFSGMQYFSAEKFQQEVHVWSQIALNMMAVDAIVYDSCWEKLNTAIRALGPSDVEAGNLGGSTMASGVDGAGIITFTAMQGMLNQVATIFDHVVGGYYQIAFDRASAEWPEIISTVVPEENRADITEAANAVIAKIQTMLA